MQDFKNLVVWQRAHRLAWDVYDVSQGFPVEERFGLTSQLRRSSVSVATNIAEGSGRGSDADFARFVQISIGSVSELEYQLLLARDLSCLTHSHWSYLTGEAVEIRKMLTGLLARLK